VKHIEASRVGKDHKDIPEGELFCIHHEQPKKQSTFILTAVELEHVFAIAIKIKGTVYQSEWFSESEGRDAAVKAMKQVLYIKRMGWTATNETKLDDINMFREPLYRCAYCQAEKAGAPDGPCMCRRVEASLVK
jgi:hypothetical protein